jgi:hypothetical protein
MLNSLPRPTVEGSKFQTVIPQAVKFRNLSCHLRLRCTEPRCGQYKRGNVREPELIQPKPHRHQGFTRGEVSNVRLLTACRMPNPHIRGFNVFPLRQRRTEVQSVYLAVLPDFQPDLREAPLFLLFLLSKSIKSKSLWDRSCRSNIQANNRNDDRPMIGPLDQAVALSAFST